MAYTDPRREWDVAEAVKRRAFETYIPAMTVTRRRSEVRRPLLPRYVFIGLRPPLTLYGLRETPGLEGLVKVSGTPVVVRPSIIAILRAEEARGCYDFSDARLLSAAEKAEAKAKAEAWSNKLKGFVPGTKVQIVSGPWLYFKGTVADGLPPDRIGVTIRIMGRESVIPMMLDDVERAP